MYTPGGIIRKTNEMILLQQVRFTYLYRKIKIICVFSLLTFLKDTRRAIFRFKAKTFDTRPNLSRVPENDFLRE